MQRVIELISVSAWSGLWIWGGWWLARYAFRLRQNEEMVVGIAIGLVLQSWFSNLASYLLQPPASYWAGASLVFVAGLMAWLTTPRRGRILLFPRLSIYQLGTLGVVLVIFYPTLRGLAIFDDYQNLPAVSLLAAGDFPPRFALDPGVRFSYHYLLQLMAASWMRIADIFPWNAWDFSQALVFALMVVACGLWVQRLTRSTLLGLASGLFTAFASGTRWLLLFLPRDTAEQVNTALGLPLPPELIADPNPDPFPAITRAWNIEGAGPMPFPFAFANGVNPPNVLAISGFGSLGILILVLMLLTHNRWRGWRGLVTSVGLVSALALIHEIWFVLVLASLAGVALAQAIVRRSLRFPTGLRNWLLVGGVSGLLAVVQGGVLSGALSGRLAPTGGESGGNYYTFDFSLIFPPALVSGQLGALPLDSPVNGLIALAEIGPLLILLPFIAVWGWRALRAERWFEAALALFGVISLGFLFVQYRGTAGPSATGRLYSGFFTVAKLTAVPLVAWVVGNRDVRKQAVALGLGALSLVSGVALFSVMLIAAARPVYSYFLTQLDVDVMSRYWNRLPVEALVFDPVAPRAPVILGRHTSGWQTWYQARPEWRLLVEDPSPGKIRAAGFDFIYYDRAYWKTLSSRDMQALQDGCVLEIDRIEDWQGDFRVLADLRNCPEETP